MSEILPRLQAVAEACLASCHPPFVNPHELLALVRCAEALKRIDSANYLSKVPRYMKNALLNLEYL